MNFSVAREVLETIKKFDKIIIFRTAEKLFQTIIQLFQKQPRLQILLFQIINLKLNGSRNHGRGHTMPFHIANQYTQAGIIYFDEVVEITANETAGLIQHININIFILRHFMR